MPFSFNRRTTIAIVTPLVLSLLVYYSPLSSSPSSSMSLSSIRAAHSKISLPGRLAIVVGGTSGLGQAMAERLAKADVSVIIVGRNKEHGNDVLTKLRSYSKTAEHSYVPLDASLLSNVNDFAEQFKASGKRLDYLVLSQGIGSMAGRTETKEGLDVKLSLHYYSRVAFAQLFAPTMATSPDPRVLSILSAGIHSPYEKYEEDPELKNNFSIKNAADAAGFYNDIAMEKLSNQFPKISFIHCAPGFVATRWGTDLAWYIRGPIRFLQLFARSMDDAGEYLSSAFFNDEYKGPGYHFMGAQGQRVKQTNLHDKAKDSVWKSTMIAVNRILGASSSSAAVVDEKH